MIILFTVELVHTSGMPLKVLESLSKIYYLPLINHGRKLTCLDVVTHQLSLICLLIGLAGSAFVGVPAAVIWMLL